MRKLIVAALLGMPCLTAWPQTVHVPSAPVVPSAGAAAASGVRIESLTPVIPVAPAPLPLRPSVGAGSGGPGAAHPGPHIHKPECEEKLVWYCEHANNCYYRKQKDC